jgi:ligand-binding sensor domain-containing protein/signal transduction histidine kinase
MPLIRRMLLAAGFLLCGLAGIFPARAGSPFFVESWDNEKGLPECAVLSVLQSRDGYLWLATLKGLARFDGNQFTIFNAHNTPGLNSDRIVYLFEDSRRTLWVATEAPGLIAIADGRVTSFDIGNGGAAGRVICAFEDDSSNVWFYTFDRRFFLYQNGKLDLHPNVFPAQLVYRAQKLLFPGRDGGFWQIRSGQIQKWRDNKLVKDFGAYPWGNTPVTSACEDKNGNLIVGTWGGGIFWYDAKGKYERVAKNEGLSSAYVLSLCLDREGNLWAGTDGGGLNRIKRKIFDTPEIHPWAALSLSADTNGGLWTAFNALGLSYQFTNSTQDFGIGVGSNAWSVLVDSQQQVWAGTSTEGLFQFQNYYFRPADGAAALGPWIYALFQDRAGHLWAGTQNGLARRDGANWKLFTTREGLSDNTVRAIAADADGNLWVGTESGGLNFFKAGKFTAFPQTENGPPGNDISCLFVDRENVLWVGTSGHGLARFRDGQWTAYSSDNGLASDSISYILEDDQGALWIGSNLGLMRILKKDFTGVTAKIPCRTYGRADGLPTSECSIGAQPAAIRTPDGQLWFPTVAGVASIHPAELQPNREPPLVMIESVLVDGRPQKTNLLTSAWSQAITIPPGGEELEIHYTGLNFSAPELVRFKCWLEGHEARPAEVGGERIARYPKLPPGNYRFHVTACNEDGIWNKSGGVLDITVQPYFWQTAGFRAAAVIFLLLIVIASVRFISTQKLKRQLQRHQQKETLEHERARIARDLHDQLGANLTQVALLGEMTEADKNLPEEIESHARQICSTARETTRSLDEIVWAVNPSNDTLEGLVNYACKYAQDYFALAGLRYRVDMPAQLPATIIPPEVRHNVFLAFKEAVHNTVKHAQASEARVRLQLSPEQFTLSVEDDGRGLGDLSQKNLRNGLKNMRKRMADIRGEFEIAPGADGGTVVRLKVPVNNN